MMAMAASASMNGVRILGSIAITDVLLTAGLAGLVYEMVTGRRARHESLGRFWVGYFLVIGGGSLGALVGFRPLAGIPHLLLFALVAAPVLLLQHWAPDLETLRRYTWAWVGGAVVSGVFGILAVGDAAGRTAGLTTHPNHFAMVSALGAGLSLGLALLETGPGKWLATSSFTVLSLAVLRSGSRAGLVALVVTGALLLAWTRGSQSASRRRDGLAISFLVLAILVVASAATEIIELGRHNAIERVLGDATTAASDLERHRLIVSGIRRIAEHPIAGSGFEGVAEIHNIYLALWAGAGLLGLLGFGLIASTTIRAAVRAQRSDDLRGVLATAYASGYVGYLIAGSAQNFLWDRYLWLHVGVILCLGASMHGSRTRRSIAGPCRLDVAGGERGHMAARKRDRWDRRVAATAFAMVMTLVTSLFVPSPASATAAGTVTLVSHSPVGPTTTPIGASARPESSSDGALIVFESTATNLVGSQSDTNGGADIFLLHRPTGTVTLVSHAAGTATTTGGGASTAPRISADGAYVVFESSADNLVPGQSEPGAVFGTNVFLFSRATGAITLVSHVPADVARSGDDTSAKPSISGDGAYVAFSSSATTLIDPYTFSVEHRHQVFIYSRTTGTVTLVSHTPASGTAAGNNRSDDPRISADGAFVAFASPATNLVTPQTDSNAEDDVFVFERATGAVTLVSHIPSSATTTSPTAYARWPSISAGGDYVTFVSTSSGLVAGQVEAFAETPDVFLYTRATGTVTLVSHTSASATTAASNESYSATISADGAFVSFTSGATSLVAGQIDANGEDDVFLFSRVSGSVSMVSHVPASTSTAANHTSNMASISADGSYVAFLSRANNLVTGQTDGSGGVDVFLYTRVTGAVTLVSHTTAGATTAANSVHGNLITLSANGSFVAFSSTAAGLVAGQNDANGVADVFLYWRIGNEHPATADFDGDSDTDISVFRPSSNTWYVRNGATTPFGAAGDIPVSCDYDGDGTSDVAVFRPSVGAWFIQNQATVFLGASGDVPVPGDYDGDGDCDPAVFRPSVGGWYRAGGTVTFFGLSGDIPVPADYDGDGITDIAVFRPSVGGWYRSGVSTVFFGLSGDIPVPANYNGSANGTADIAVYRPSVGGWYAFAQTTQFLGLSSDIPVPGDYDGNGVADRAVFRPASGAWFVATPAPVFFGLIGDRPLPLPSAIRQAFFP
jgi:Tol biopolymer transport system component